MISPSHTFPYQRSNTMNSRRSTSANSEQLQIKLRRLINDSSLPKETAFDAYTVNNSKIRNNYCRRPSFSFEDTKFEPPHQFRQTSPKRYTQEVN